MVRLFYAVPDFYPPWRLDVGHLFGEELINLSMEVSWSMWRDSPGRCEAVKWQGQQVFLPHSFGRRGGIARILSRLSYTLCDFSLFVKMLKNGRYEIIQVRDLRYSTAFLGWLAARLSGAKFTFWLSYPFPEHYLEWARTSSGPSKLVRWLQGSISFHFLYKWLMHRADHIFVQSEQMKTDVASYGVPIEKMTSVPMGVPPALLDWLDHNPTPVVSGRIVYVGTLARVRRLETLIQSFALVAAQVEEATLVMVGDGDNPSERIFLEEEAKRLGVSDKVQFTGFVPMEDAWRYAASAAVCVSPFYPTFVLRSTSPTKLNEYLALGRPVVANDHPEQSRVIAESGAGLCVEWSVEGFAEAMTQLLKDTEGAELMASKGPAWVRKNRTYDHIASLVMEKYQNLIAVNKNI